MHPQESQVVRAVAIEAKLATELLQELIAIARSPVGRTGARGVGTRVAGLIEKAANHGGRLAAAKSSTPASDGEAASLDDVSIKRIALRNFLQFRDAELFPETTAARPLSLITGHNGYGKTALVNAIHWVLHDRMPGWTKRDRTRLIHHGSGETETRVEVELELSSVFDGRIAVRRFVVFKRRGGDWRLSDRGEVTVTIGATGRTLRSEEAEEWLNHRFPAEVLSYFVFDAESTVVQQLSGQAGEQLPDISGVVEAALDVAPLRKMQNRCKRRASALRRQRQEATDERSEADIQAELARLEAKISASRRDLSGAEERAALLADNHQRLREDWDGLKARIDPERQQHAQGLQSELEAVRGDLVRTRRKLERTCHEALPLRLLADVVETIARGQAEAESERSGDWHSGVREACTRIGHLAVEGRIPWREDPLPDANRITTRLLELLELPPEVGGNAPQRGDRIDVGELSALLRLLADNAARDSHGAALPGLMARLLERQRELELELRDLGPTSLAPGWEQELEGKQAALEAAAKERALNEQDRQSVSSDLESLVAERDALGTALSTAKAHDRQREKLRAEEILAEKLAGALDKVADRVRRSRVETLEHAATTMLRRTAHKAELFERLAIDRNTLRYQLLDSAGEPVPPGRSTGERTVLALCLVYGLQKASGCRFPLVLEAPLKPLDSDHQEAVMRHFLTGYPGQTLLLVKPGEIPQEYMRLCRDRLATSLRLVRPDAREERTGIVADDGSAAA